MSIERLKALVAPPVKAFEVGTLDQWQKVERELGTQLPSDFRDFVFTYGSGLFAQFYRVYNPFSASEFTGLARSVQRVCAAVREIKRDWPDTVPYRIYPDRPGL